MKLKFFSAYLTIILALWFQVCSTQKDIKSSEYTLYKNLFKNYKKSTRPVNDWKEKVNISISIAIRKIAKVIEDHQTVNLYVLMQMSWVDVNLIWNSAEYNNLESIVLPADNIWIPDLHLFNSATEDDRIYPLNVEVFSNGTVVTYPVTSLFAHCDFNFKNFPYDTQTCDFMIGTFYHKSKVGVSLSVITETEKMLPNPEWNLIGVNVIPTWALIFPGLNPDKEDFNVDWSSSKFTIRMKRSSSFYVNLFVWPLIFILFITMSIFILPPTCVERATMGVLLLLTLVIISLMLESYIPKNTFGISVIGKLIGFTMFMVTWSTVFATLIVGIDRDNFVFRTIPPWLKNIMVNYVAKLVFKFETVSSILSDIRIKDEDIEVIDTNQILQQQSRQQTNDISENDDLINIANSSGAATSSQANSGNSSSLDLTQAQTLIVLINNQLAMLRMRLQEKDLKEQNKKEWYLIASTLDRFCLFIYVIIMLLGLFIIFV